GRGLLAERQLRHDVGLVVDVEQLVTQRRKDDARGVEARQRRIERIAVVAQPDAQLGLRRGGGGEKAKGEGEGGAAEHGRHGAKLCTPRASWTPLRPRHRGGEREGPIAKRWEGEVGRWPASVPAYSVL